MTDPTEPDPTGPTDATRPEEDATGTADRRRRLLLVVAVALVAVAVVVALLVRGGGDASTDPSSAPGSTSEPGPTSEPGDAGSGDDAADGASTAPGDAPVDREQPPVALDASPVLVDEVTLRVESLTSVDAEAALPGEVAGPGVSVTVVVDNAGDEPLDLSTTVVNVYSGAALTPGNAVSTGTSPFPGRVDGGSTATGTYVFTVPAEERDAVRVTVDAAVDLPTIVFEGSAG